MAGSPKDTLTKSHCNQCVGTRDHDTLHRETTDWLHDNGEDPHSRQYNEISGSDIYEMLRCRGCGYVSMRHSSWCSEDYDDDGGPVERVKYFPPAISRRKPGWLNSFDSPFWLGDSVVEQLLEEIYSALHNDSRRIAAMGVRALLEHVMIDGVGDQGSFLANIEAFADAGHLSHTQRERLQTILEAGHASIHRDFKPSKEDLKTLLDISEGLIADVYIHPARTDKLKEKVPPRKPKPKKV